MAAAARGELIPIDVSNWRAALRVRVGEEQLKHVADYQPVGLVVLAKAYVRPGGRRWEPLAFVVDDQIIAVLALTYGDRSVEMVNLAVDIDHQRQGVGTAVVAEVLRRARKQDLDVVELTVHPDNAAAIALYRELGFSPTDDHRDGERFMRYRL
ncbi:MAG: GNAT family N-acetyltransferase [Actinomycetota bacterium]